MKCWLHMNDFDSSEVSFVRAFIPSKSNLDGVRTVDIKTKSSGGFFFFYFIFRRFIEVLSLTGDFLSLLMSTQPW